MREILANGDRPSRRMPIVCLNMRPPPSAPAQMHSDEDKDDVPALMTRSTVQSYFVHFGRDSHRQSDQDRYVKQSRARDSPSVAAKSTHYYEIQGSDARLLDGRVNDGAESTSAPPIELYHPAFAAYIRHANDPNLDVPDDILRKTAELLRILSRIAVREHSRYGDTRQVLADILGIPMGTSTNSDRTAADFVASASTPLHQDIAIKITEIKGEQGAGGCDASVQAAFSFDKHVCMDEVSQIHSHFLLFSLSFFLSISATEFARHVAAPFFLSV